MDLPVLGYDFGKLLQSGVEITNLTDNSFLYINTNTSQQIAVWDTGIVLLLWICLLIKENTSKDFLKPYF